MDRWMGGTRIWPAAYRYWHIYLVPDRRRDPELFGLIGECQRVLAGFPAIATVPLPWLHCPVQRIGGKPAAERGADEREALIAALADTVPTLPALTLTAGPPMPTRHGVLLDLGPDRLYDHVYHVVRGAIRLVCGAAAVSADSRPPHIPLGYAQGPQDSDAVQSALRVIRPNHATLTVSSVHLVDVVQDVERCQYRWTVLASFRMAAARQHQRA